MKIIKDKRFYVSILTIVIPMALQNLISFGINMADTVMLGLADNTGAFLSGSSLANQPFFVLNLFIFGISGAGTVLGSQYWGKGDIKSVKSIISMVMKIAFAVSLAATFFVTFFPETVMRLYTDVPETIAAGVEYLRIVGWSYVLCGISATFICSLRCVEIVKISVVTNLISFALNVFLNWILIFGNLGAPALGIAGAAIATLTSRIVEVIVVLIFVFFVDKRLDFKFRDMLLADKALFKDLARHGAPVVVNEVMWSLGISVQAAILGHIGYSAGDPVAANTICGIVQQLATVFIFGMANAAAVLVGKSIGENKNEEAMQKASTFKLIALVFGILSCALIFFLRDFATEFYSFSEATESLAKDMLIVVAVNVIFISLSSVYIVGILRGGGDTKFCLIVELVSLWGVSVPVAAFLAFFLNSPVPLVLLGMRLDEPLKSLLCTIRTRNGNWIKNVTR